MSSSPSQEPTAAELANTEMTFGEHLEELRKRLWRSLMVSIAGLLVAFIWHEELFAFVVGPYREAMEARGQSPQLNQFGVQDAFFAYVKVSFIVGLICTAPFWIYQLWAFVAAGLYATERRMVYRLVPLCVVLFVAGISFGYSALIPIGVEYMTSFGDPDLITPNIGIKQYLGLFTVLTLVLGIAFQLPVFMIGLVRSGLVTLETLQTKRKYTIVGIFVVAAIVTPPDPVTQIMMAGPLLTLYELGVLLSWIGMGADRPPVNWKAKWPLLKRVVIVLALLFLCRGPLMDFYEGVQADGRVLQRDDKTFPVIEMVEELLGRPVTVAVRVMEEDDDSELLVASGDQYYLVKVHRDRRKDLVMDRNPDAPGGARIKIAHWAGGLATHELSLPTSYPVGPAVKALRETFAYGGPEAQKSAQLLLQQVAGLSLSLDGDVEEGLRAIDQWLEQHGAAVRQQVLPKAEPGNG